MRRRSLAFLFGILTVAGSFQPAPAQSLRGSHASLVRQRQWARSHDFTFLDTASDVRRFVEEGLLVPLSGNGDYELDGASFPYARPEIRTFVIRLASQYRRACGEKLVLTSLTRPSSRQPRNASRLSVHPTGMAIDLRRSRRQSCRRWLEQTLLALEEAGVLEATSERRPPHYHVAVFPRPYVRYVTVASEGEATAAAGDRLYRVRAGDSLWSIAREHGVTIRRLRSANHLRSSRIVAGQTLLIPPAG
ncbi:MAG: DUF5715 family protein [Candidatus Binatia bacterium]